MRLFWLINGIKKSLVISLMVSLLYSLIKTGPVYSYPSEYPQQFQPFLKELGCERSQYDINSIPGTVIPTYVYGIFQSDNYLQSPSFRTNADSAAFICFISHGEYQFGTYKRTGPHFLLVLVDGLERHKPRILQTVPIGRSYPGGMVILKDEALLKFNTGGNTFKLMAIDKNILDKKLSGYFVFAYDGLRFTIFKKNNDWYFQAWD